VVFRGRVVDREKGSHGDVRGWAAGVMSGLRGANVPDHQSRSRQSDRNNHPRTSWGFYISLCRVVKTVALRKSRRSRRGVCAGLTVNICANLVTRDTTRVDKKKKEKERKPKSEAHVRFESALTFKRKRKEGWK
jgi:hypothetical protein